MALEAVISITTSKTIHGRTGHHCLTALRIRYGSIIHNSCFSLSDAPRWSPAQSMFYNGILKGDGCTVGPDSQSLKRSAKF